MPYCGVPLYIEINVDVDVRLNLLHKLLKTRDVGSSKTQFSKPNSVTKTGISSHNYIA